VVLETPRASCPLLRHATGILTQGAAFPNTSRWPGKRKSPTERSMPPTGNG
jgi:hypothetical protein